MTSTVTPPAPDGQNTPAILNAWSRTLGNDLVIEFPDDAVYPLDSTWTVLDDKDEATGRFDRQGRDWDIRCNGATFTRTPGLTGTTGPQLLVLGGKDWQLHDYTVRGGNPDMTPSAGSSRESHHALHVQGAASFCVYDFEHTEPHGDLLYVGRRKVKGTEHGRDAYVWCSDFWVTGGKMHRSGRQGVTLQGAERGVVMGNDIWDVPRSLIEMEPLTAAFNQANDIAIVRNRLGYSRLALLTNSGSGPCHRIDLSQNLLARSLLVYGKDGDGGYRDDWRICDNRYLTAATAIPGGVPAPANRPHHGAPTGCAINLTKYRRLTVQGNEQDLDGKRSPKMVLVQSSESDGVVSMNLLRDVFGGSGPHQYEYLRPGTDLRVVPAV